MKKKIATTLLVLLLILIGYHPIKANDRVQLVQTLSIYSNQQINGDLAIANNTTLIIDGKCSVTGSLYNWGRIVISENGSLKVNNTIYTYQFHQKRGNSYLKQASGEKEGCIENYGKISYKKLSITNSYRNKSFTINNKKYQPLKLNTKKSKSGCSKALYLNDDQSYDSFSANQDVYVLNNTKITFKKDATIKGDLYIYGSVTNLGKLSVSGKIYCLHYGKFNASNIKKGYLYKKGKISAKSIEVKSGYLKKSINNDSHQKQNKTLCATMNVDGYQYTCCGSCGIIIKKSSIPKIKQIKLSQSSYQYDAKVKTPTIKVYDRFNKLIDSSNYSIKYAKGRRDVGSYDIDINFKNKYRGSKKISFKITSNDIKDASLSLIKNQVYNGKAIIPGISVKDGNRTLVKNKDYQLIYSNNVDVGTASVMIKGIGNYKNSKTTNFKIEPRDISTATVKYNSSVTYNGKKQVISPTISYANQILKANVDYKISYQDNLNAGKAKLIITGINNYKGKITRSFTIKPRTITSSSVSGLAMRAYTGKKIEPIIRVQQDNQVLKKDKDYRVSYQNATNCGIATIKIIGIGNYQNTKTVNFYIVPNKVQWISIKTSKAHDLSINIVNMKQSAYQISYRELTSNKWYNIYTNSNRINIKNLKPNKSYEVKIRGYIRIGQDTYFAPYSDIKQIKIK